MRSPTQESLSARQTEIANMVVSGKSSGEIAEALFLSPRTVEHHIEAIFNKLGVGSRVELVTAFLSSGAGVSENPADRKRTFFATMPSPRNPYFTGREGILQQIRDTLQQRHRVALSGLGGVGKTQAALEYAYRLSDAYDEVFWIGVLRQRIWCVCHHRAYNHSGDGYGPCDTCECTALVEIDHREIQRALDAIESHTPAS